MILEFELSQDERHRWARLRDYSGPVAMNGITLAPRAEDRVTSTMALTPYVKWKEPNRIELAEPQTGQPIVELLPRVFLAGAGQSEGRLRVLIENTLDNAANVQVEISELGVRDAYVPPESQFEISFPSVPAPSTEIRLTKFPEAVEEGYTTRARLGDLARMKLRDSTIGAMVCGRGSKSSCFHLLEPFHFLERPRDSE